jgi:hypothetical protein
MPSKAFTGAEAALQDCEDGQAQLLRSGQVDHRRSQDDRHPTGNRLGRQKDRGPVRIWHGVEANANGGVYQSPSLSAYSGGVIQHLAAVRLRQGRRRVRRSGTGSDHAAAAQPDTPCGRARWRRWRRSGVSIRIDNNGKEVTTNESMLQQFGNEITFVERKYRELQSRDLKAGGVLSRSAMQ